MHQPAVQFVLQAVHDALNFDGDATALASQAQDGDQDAISELTRAHAALAVLTGIRLRPAWLSKEDAAQEAMLVLRDVVEGGSERIAVEVPGAIEARFSALENSPTVLDVRSSPAMGTLSAVDQVMGAVVGVTGVTRPPRTSSSNPRWRA